MYFQTGDDRIILTWADRPSDLDIHLSICGTECEVYYAKKNCENLNLDIDVTNGYGPETMTLASGGQLAQTYVLWVYTFSCSSRSTTSSSI